MKFVNFIRRLIALPFSIVGVVLLLVALAMAMPFILIGRVVGPSDGQVSSSEAIGTLTELLNKLSNSDDDVDESGNDTPRIAFQVKRLDKAFFS